MKTYEDEEKQRKINKICSKGSGATRSTYASNSVGGLDEKCVPVCPNAPAAEYDFTFCSLFLFV